MYTIALLLYAYVILGFIEKKVKKIKDYKEV